MKRVLLYGAGVSAKGAERLLEKKGILFEHYCDGMKRPSLTGIDAVIKSPGIPNTTEFLQEVATYSIEIIDEIELAYRFLPKNVKVVAITGTNGKTTTTLNTYRALKTLGYRVEMAGNIGISFASVVANVEHLEIIVLELSSFQLEHLKSFRADIAVLLNLTPDHLDRYESVQEYYEAKWNIFAHQQEEGVAILNARDREILSHCPNSSLCEYFSLYPQERAKIYWDKGSIYCHGEVMSAEIIEKFGTHNVDNCLAIIAILYTLGHRGEALLVAQSSFESAEHRLEKFYQTESILFYNDSKATNIEAAQQAIESLYPLAPIHMICGGKEKNLTLTPLVETMKLRGVKRVYLIGELGPRFEKVLEESHYLGEIVRLETLEEVVAQERALVEGEPHILLLAPSTSSFDQFKNFEERGRHFKALVVNAFGG